MRKRALVRIEANVTWRVAFDPSTGVYMGVCEPLNLNAIGDDWPDFQEAANDALSTLMEDLFQDDELEAFLRRRGWTQHGMEGVGGRTPRFEVPYSIDGTPVGELTARA